jgi:DNA-binding SARP family transcriptional activator
LLSENVRDFRLDLLRGFSLTVDGRRIPLIWSAQRLVAFLALKERPLTRTYVAEALWPETSRAKANANLRSTLWRVQRSCGNCLLEVSVQQICLAPHVVVDLVHGSQVARRLLDASRPCDDILTAETRAHLAADVLPDWYDDDWVIVEREQFHQLRLHALEAMSARLVSAARYGEAVDAGLAAVMAEPLRESAHRALIEAHLAAGNLCDAVRQYRDCERLLLEELGVQPSGPMRRLFPTHHLLTYEQARL